MRDVCNSKAASELLTNQLHSCEAECCRLSAMLRTSKGVVLIFFSVYDHHAVSSLKLPRKHAHLLPWPPKQPCRGGSACLQLWPASCRVSPRDLLLVTSAGGHQRTAPGSLEGQRGVHQALAAVRRRCQGGPQFLQEACALSSVDCHMEYLYRAVDTTNATLWQPTAGAHSQPQVWQRPVGTCTRDV